MPWRWYAAKTLYRSRARGRARNTNPGYDAVSTLVEERVVLVKARSFAEALRRGEREARAYAKLFVDRRNRYGQLVTTDYLKTIDVFELFDPPKDGAEVYSNTYVIPRSTSDRALVDNHFGSTRQSLQQREQFVDAEIERTQPPRHK